MAEDHCGPVAPMPSRTSSSGMTFRHLQGSVSRPPAATFGHWAALPGFAGLHLKRHFRVTTPIGGSPYRADRNVRTGSWHERCVNT